MKNTLFLLIGILFLLSATSIQISEVDDLINKQQFQEASKKLAPLVEEARKSKNDKEYAKLLIKETLLKIGLHGYETSVEDLKKKEWPKDPLSHAMLSIIYARSLKLYHEAYSWEIRKREQITTKDKFDLKTLTTEEIFAEAYKAYDDAWKLRDKLGSLPRDAMSEIIEPNHYPKEVRGSLRDSMSYLFAGLMNDSSGWKPSESHEIFLLNLSSLIEGKKKVSPTHMSTHPLEKISSILTDLESWHNSRKEKDAALEARLEKYRIFSQHFSGENYRKELIALLTRDLEKSSVPWTSMGYALLADMWKGSEDADGRIKAHQYALRGNKLFSNSPGAARCRDIIREIEQPSFEVQGMNIDTQGKNSIGINFKNLRKLYFKSVLVDFKEFIKTTKDYSLRPGWRELEGYLRATPVQEWSVPLLETKDYGNHFAYVIPPKHKNGFYVILASNEETFKTGVLQGIQAFFSDMTFDVARDYESEEFKIEVSKGNKGEAVKGASVSLYVADYQKGHQLKDEEKSDEHGIATFKMKSFLSNSNGNYFFIVEKDGNIVGSRNPTYMYKYGKSNNETHDAFIYTDRSIYRPEQKILWKIVAYTGDGEKKFKIDNSKDVEVTLQDANGEKVQTVKVRTNTFGSASGEFKIPKGRLLGNWSIFTSHGGNSYVKIEEYKRPTFLVEMSDKGAEFRLNREAIIKGNGKYYFGMPLSNGTAKWTIHRTVILPWWCFWGGFNWGRSQGDALVSTGSSKLANDGGFEIKFTPTADEKLNGDDIKYSYRVKVDVTDEGGETQSTDFNTTIGLTAVQAALSMEDAFYLSGAKPKINFRRTDLNGKPLSGKAKWKLVRLKEPSTTLTPAELPLPHELKKLGMEFKHPDDLKLKRWAVNYQPEQYLREWEAGEGIKTGDLAHSASGNAEATLPELKTGVYRVTYETTDIFGTKFETQKEFMVVDQKTNFKLPGFFAVQRSSVEVGEKARLLVMSGFPNQRIVLEIFKKNKLFKRQEIISGKDMSLIEIPIKEEDRGGMGFTVRLITDFQEIKFNQTLMVPWTNKEIEVAFSTMRDKMRPGSKETWSVSLKGKNGRKIEAESFEILAYMYDKSLDSFTPHTTPVPLGIYPVSTGVNFPESELGAATLVYTNRNSFPYSTEFSGFREDTMKFYPNYGIGGPGRRSRGGIAMLSKGMSEGMANEASMDMAAAPAAKAMVQGISAENAKSGGQAPAPEKPVEVRTNFSENGFWKPHLVPGKDGSVKFEFTVPDSVTSWQVWAHAISKDLQSGKVNKETRTIKELMVRPYLPRFFREGDEATLKVVINNSSDKEMNGELKFDILDDSQKISVAKEFALDSSKVNFSVKAQGSTNVSFKVKAPVGSRNVAVKVVATSGSNSDGEVRPLPVLPGRVHLAESKFVTLKNKDKKTLTFPGLANTNDPTLVNDLFVVTLDAQLFYSVLSSVPYLVNYPYQSTEQIMNSFVATGILSSVFHDFPEVSKMAREMSSRKTQFEKWSEPDPNRKLALEEAPWLALAKGGPNTDDEDLISVLHPDIARNTRNKNLRMLQESQTANGGFPWFSGGPPSPSQTLYLLYGFSKAIEFKVDVPKPMISKAWGYLHQHYINEVVSLLIGHDTGWEFVTFLNYVLSNYPDTSWSGNVFTDAERKVMLDFSFRHWKDHSPYLKSYLAMTLKRSKREEDAKLVWASVMDSAKISDDEGTHWAQEDRTWLWYNDTIETHAMALRTGQELGTKREALDGLVQWLFLNKKLNHWKSTRGTAEVLYSLTHFLKSTKQLGVKEKIEVKMAGEDYKFDFDPDKYTGKKNQIVIPQDKVRSALVPVTVEKSTKGLAFASATWHYSTETLPKTAVGDFFKVSRKFFKRDADKGKIKLIPINDGDAVDIGDEVEVQISLSSKHPAEYVHLRDPRAAGFEPVDGISKHKWDLGIYWYEEIRDSGTNFFFENLPQGQYTFKYRIRASTSGKFRAGPATIQPLYAPEFVGFSEGHELFIK